MYKIGENIHIISDKVKAALKDRDGAFFVSLVRAQKEAGADVIDLNIGRRKKDGPEIVDWLVDCVRYDQPGCHRGRAEESGEQWHCEFHLC